jgi:hypothetical protein
VVLNLPWLVPTLQHSGGALSDPAGVAAFSARAESWGPAILSVPGLGGIWNGDVVPTSRSVPLMPILTLLVVGVAILGLRRLAARWGVAPTRSLVVLGVFGVLLASLATLPLGEPLLSWSMNHIPGAGLLRDAQKWVAWLALPVALGFALAVEAAATRWRSLFPVAALLPLILMPDLAWAGWNRLETVQYPDDWAAVHDVLDGRPGDVLALPLSAFRQYDWNNYRTQLDPAPRALPNTVIIDDTLRVGDQAIPGEDKRLERIRASHDLAGEGIGWVLVEHGTPGVVETRFLDGATVVWSGRWLTLYRTPGELKQTAVSWFPVMAANGVALISIVTALLCSMLPMRRLTPSRISLAQKE